MGTESIMSELNSGEITWIEAVDNMTDLMFRLNLLEEAKERLYGNKAINH